MFIIDLPLGPVRFMDAEDIDYILLQKPHAMLERPHHFYRVYKSLCICLPHRIGVLLPDGPFKVPHFR